jgi:predicted ester cyclase
MNIKDFAEKFIKAEEEIWHKGNFKPLEALEHPDVYYHLPPPNQDAKGFEAHKQQILGMKAAFSNVKQEWKYLAGDGNVFALSYKAAYTSSGKIPGFPPAGKIVSSDTIWVFQIKNDKVIEGWANGSVTGFN